MYGFADIAIRSVQIFTRRYISTKMRAALRTFRAAGYAVHGC
jgi:hypothetical protein